MLDTFEQRAVEADHFEFYCWPHTDVVMTRTNTRLPVDAAHKKPGAVANWVEERLMQNGALGVKSALGSVDPALDPRDQPVRHARLRRPRVHRRLATTCSRARARSASGRCEYALPRPAIAQALRDIRGLIERQGWRIGVPDRGARRRPRRQLAVDRLPARVRLHRDPPVLARGSPAATSAPSTRCCAATTAGRTGARSTSRMPRSSPAATRGSPTSAPCETASTPTGCSPTPTSTGCWAHEAAMRRSCPAGLHRRRRHRRVPDRGRRRRGRPHPVDLGRVRRAARRHRRRIRRAASPPTTTTGTARTSR